MKDKEEKFLYFYMEQTWNEMRHLENLRERSSFLILTIASVILGFIVQQKLEPETRLMIWLVILLSLVGIIMGLKLFQLHQMGQKRLDMWYSYHSENGGESSKILEIKNLADEQNKKDFKIVSRMPHNYFWTVIHFFILAIGIIMLFQINEPAKASNHINLNNKVKNHIDTANSKTYESRLDSLEYLAQIIDSHYK